MKKEYLTMPNFVTSIRLFGAIILLFLKPLSIPFYIIYIISGASDAVDGFVARKMGGETEFGSKLDSISDLTFFGISLLKVLPLLIEQLPKMIWYFVSAIIAFRILMYILNALYKKEFLTSHTFLNKASTVMLFIIVLLINTRFLTPFAWMTVGITIIAAIYEFTYSLYLTYIKRKK